MTPDQARIARHLAEKVCKWTPVEVRPGTGFYWKESLISVGVFDPFTNAIHNELVVDAFRGPLEMHRSRPHTRVWECLAYWEQGNGWARCRNPSRLTAVCEAIYRATGGTL